MVATRGTDHAVAFVTGQQKIDPSVFTAAQWVEILYAALEELPVKYMRGLRSITQILHKEGDFGVNQVVRGPMCRLFPEGESKSPGNEIKPNAVFLECADRGTGLFPAGIYAWETYPKAPEKPFDQNGDDESLASITTEHFLLSRDSTFYYLKVTWLPKTKWEEKSMSSTPESFWYELDHNSVTIERLDVSKFSSLLQKLNERRIPQTILQRFDIALTQTVDDVRGQYERILSSKLAIEGYLNRIG